MARHVLSVFLSTGYSHPPAAASAIEEGFLESMAAARFLWKQISNPFSFVFRHARFLNTATSYASAGVDIPFILSLINRTAKYESQLPPPPQENCEGFNESSLSPASRNSKLSETRQKFQRAVRKSLHAAKREKDPAEEAQSA